VRQTAGDMVGYRCLRTPIGERKESMSFEHHNEV